MEVPKLHNHILEQVALKKSYFRAKRFFDIVIGLGLLILATPVLLAFGLLILIIDGPPVMFRQPRIGLNGETFIIWKFRTMKEHDPGLVHNHHWIDKVADDFVFKTEINPYVTRLGFFIRKYSIDELPQLINVIKGDMSLVGPRPEIPQITKFYDAIQRQRLLVKPGITGYAQVNGRSDMTHGEKISNDLYYVSNCSLLLDFKIICKSFIQVLSSKGSY
jgi:lipopolysaccharide/colanic/teichoic acid biosynthesis glycosyltransferase